MGTLVNIRNSHKFWDIKKDSERKMIVTNWGKSGRQTQTKEEPYEDESKADLNIKKQIEKKRLRGYKPSNPVKPKLRSRSLQ